LAPVLMGVVWVWGPLLRGLKIQESLLDQAIPYLHALNWSTLPLLLYFVFRRYLQGINLAKPVMFSLLTANLINVLGNWALIYGHLGFRAMGTVGSGWATCVGRVYMAMVLLVYCIYYDLRYKTGLREASKRVHLPRVWRLVSLGFPAATQLGLEVGIFAVATAMISKLGPIQLAAHQVAMNTASFTYMVPLGIGSAAAVRVGQALGKRDAHAASRAGWTALALGSSFMILTATAFWLVPRYIVRIYSPDPGVIRSASQLLFVAAFFQLFDGMQAVATGALRGAGETRAPMICSVLLYWLVGLPLGYYLCFAVGWGAAGVWTGLCLALILIGSSLLLLWRREEKSFAGRLVPVNEVRIGDAV
jgi:MATE family multidrug resistance protein